MISFHYFYRITAMNPGNFANLQTKALNLVLYAHPLTIGKIRLEIVNIHLSDGINFLAT